MLHTRRANSAHARPKGLSFATSLDSIAAFFTCW
jgi:hypothetical protein